MASDPVRLSTSLPRIAQRDLDVDLVRRFAFRCRPDCGLCCFTSPRLERGDESRLLQIAPDARVVPNGRERCLAARPDGGACQFLTQLRCRVHAARPAPCREFPISVHIGERFQASVVLSCPGIDLGPLASGNGLSKPEAFSGLEDEIAAVLSRLGPSTERERGNALRRRRKVVARLEREGRWRSDAEVRGDLKGRSLVPDEREYALEPLPTAEEGPAFLPIFFDRRPGPVALAQGLGGWEALEIQSEGGAHSLGVFVPPSTPPELDAPGRRLLDGYLQYWLARDALLASVHLDMLERASGTVTEAVLERLHDIGSSVFARGAVRAKLRGRGGERLTESDVANGIRAADLDWLDRPTWGSRL